VWERERLHYFFTDNLPPHEHANGRGGSRLENSAATTWNPTPRKAEKQVSTVEVNVLIVDKKVPVL